MGRAARIKAEDIVTSAKITHKREDIGLTQCPVTKIYWICVWIPHEGWKVARVADERDFRYVTK